MSTADATVPADPDTYSVITMAMTPTWCAGATGIMAAARVTTIADTVTTEAGRALDLASARAAGDQSKGRSPSGPFDMRIAVAVIDGLQTQKGNRYHRSKSHPRRTSEPRSTRLTKIDTKLLG